MDIGAALAGIEAAGFCECNAYCRKILRQHWPDVPIFSDIRKLKGCDAPEIDIIYGGFPCQDLSNAGRSRKRGLSGERSGLWFEMLRVAGECRPEWFVAENVESIYSQDDGNTVKTIVAGLVRIGYEVECVCTSAATYGAAFEGRRAFIAAASGSKRHGRSPGKQLALFRRLLVEGEPKRDSVWGEAQGRIVRAVRSQASAPGILRSDYGVPDWVDRVKAIDNAVYPLQAYAIFQPIVSIFNGHAANPAL